MADICSEVDITQAVVTSTEIKKLQETGNSSSKLKVQKLLMVDKAFFFFVRIQRLLQLLVSKK